MNDLSRLDSAVLGLLRAYLLAKRDVLIAGYEAEIAWQESVRPERVTATIFLREAAWVVLCSGMRESVVRSCFARMGEAMCGWVPERIAMHPAECRRRGLDVFRHPNKIDAVLEIASRVSRDGVQPHLKAVDTSGPRALCSLPYIGPTTCYHLAKNLGFPVAKPDRHLARIAASCGRDVDDLCGTIAELLDEPIAVVDLVLWRFATINVGYLDAFGGQPDCEGSLLGGSFSGTSGAGN